MKKEKEVCELVVERLTPKKDIKKILSSKKRLKSLKRMVKKIVRKNGEDGKHTAGTGVKFKQREGKTMEQRIIRLVNPRRGETLS